MASYYCKTCGKLDEEGISGHATNRCKGATNTKVVATNKANGETPLDQPVIPVTPQGVGVDSPERRTPNRRSKEAYNAYQRDYMRKRRATQETKAS